MTDPESPSDGASQSTLRAVPCRSVEFGEEPPVNVPLQRPPLPAPRGLPPRMLQRVLEYLDDHLEGGVSLQELASVAGLSTSHFVRSFKRSLGVTPRDYLLECRVRRAQALLARTDLPVSEIARRCGFADQSHCTRLFRERMGVTPRKYRASIYTDLDRCSRAESGQVGVYPAWVK
jgi:transcriptional regulator GlxA family with amidase domain